MVHVQLFAAPAQDRFFAYADKALVDHYNLRLDKTDAEPCRPKPTFQGFRFISVENNVMTKIRYVRLTDLRDSGLRMSWEPEDFRGEIRIRHVGVGHPR